MPSITGVLCVASKREFKKNLQKIASCDILVLGSFGLKDRGNSLAKSYSERNPKGKIVRFYDYACIGPGTALVGDYYIQKPFNVDQFMTIIWRAQNALGLLHE